MSKKQKYDRFNTMIKNYAQALENSADPEELHSRLRGIISEAINTDMTLAELLEILSGKGIGGSTEEFIENVSSHYRSGAASAKIMDDESKVRKEKEDRNKNHRND
ncbi:hypothetical protein N9W34_00130 [Rickettsiales bacterium]|nr:hypothetical protein [Rickettsiales bacterium]